MSDFPERNANWEEDFRFDRLKSAVEKTGGNAAVAGKSGIAVSTLSSYMNGAEWKVSVARKIADACGVSLQWLLFGANDAASAVSAGQDKATAHSEVAQLDYYDTLASGGFGRPSVFPVVPQKMAVSRAFLDGLGLVSKHTVLMHMVGDSMEPTIHRGEQFFLSTMPAPMLDGMCLIAMQGQVMARRLATSSEGIRIIADNDRYPTSTVDISRFRWGQSTGPDDVTVIGRIAYCLKAMS